MQLTLYKRNMHYNIIQCAICMTKKFRKSAYKYCYNCFYSETNGEYFSSFRISAFAEMMRREEMQHQLLAKRRTAAFRLQPLEDLQPLEPLIITYRTGNETVHCFMHSSLILLCMSRKNLITASVCNPCF